MEELKSLFGDGSLSYEEFEQKLGETKEIKLANLESGNYVDKDKYTKLEKKYNDYAERFESISVKLVQEEKILNDYLQTISEKTNYKKWYFGHYHKDIRTGSFVGVFESVLRLGE